MGFFCYNLKEMLVLVSEILDQMLAKTREGWRGGSEVTTAGCSPEDLSCQHVSPMCHAAHNHSSSKGSDAFFWPLQSLGTHMRHTHTHINKYKKKVRNTNVLSSDLPLPILKTLLVGWARMS